MSALYGSRPKGSYFVRQIRELDYSKGVRTLNLVTGGSLTMDEEGEVDEWNISIDIKERKTEGPRRGPDIIDLVQSENVIRES